MARERSPWRERLYIIIFEAETPAGKAFDVVLLVAILLSVVAVALETVKDIGEGYPRLFEAAEWSFTILFTIEYIVRVACARRTRGYIFSFFGVIDLMATLPTWLAFAGLPAGPATVLRAFRLLRVFRIFHMGRLVREADALLRAMIKARARILVFLSAILVIVVVIGTMMYHVEGQVHGFESIPQAMYWSIVTVTTVGYGDIAPQTAMGRSLAALLMLLGYSLIIVPTGLVAAAAEAARRAKPPTWQVCSSCGREGHDADATHCKHCGSKLTDRATPPR